MSKAQHEAIVFQATASDGRFYPSCMCGWIGESGASLDDAFDTFDTHAAGGNR